VRPLFKQPFRTAALIIFLGGCVALNAAIFATVDGALFKPLPFPGAERLAAIGRDLRASGGSRPGPVSRTQLRDLMHAPGTEATAAWTSGVIARDRAAEDRLRSIAVTAGFFELLGAHIAVGRTLTTRDRTEGAVVPVVISDAFWRARFASDRGVIDAVVTLGDVPSRVIGIAPRGFDFPLGATVWNLVDLDAPGMREIESLSAITRLQHVNSCPTEVPGMGVRCLPLRQMFAPRHTRSLVLVLVAATALMAMTWFQVACLELARTLTRMHEVGVRLAVGATRTTLFKETLAQGAVLAAGALAFGTLLLPALLSWIVSLLPPEFSASQPIAADHRSLLFSGLLALGIVASFSVIPIHALTRVNPVLLLRGSAGGPAVRRLTAPWTIVVAQVAFSTALVYLACLTVRSMQAVSAVNLGYQVDGRVALRLPDAAAGGPTIDFEQLAERLRHQPSIAAVAGSDGRPLGGPSTMVHVGLPGEATAVRARMVGVTPEYFRTLGLPVLAGRGFTTNDTRATGFAAIVNRPLARRLGLGQWQDGRRLTLLGMPATLVGLVGEAILTRPDDPDQEAIFVPTTQWVPPAYLLASSAAGADGQRAMLADMSAVLGQMAAPRSYTLLLLTDEMRRSTAGYRARMILLLAIAGSGVALCAMGVYGGVTYLWTSMRRSVAVRLAVGGTPGTVRLHLLRSLTIRIGIGLVIGIAGGAAAGRMGAAFLFGLAPFDLVSAAAAVSVVSVACACAAMAPAIRIGRVQPAEALRND
jgi:putative ABC transport system permease protein